MKIARFCLGASKLQHLLRFYGEALTPVFADGDATIDLTLKRLAPGLTPQGRARAAFGEKLGGLSARRLNDQAIAC
eukprot:4166546-Lingulodinium_polyedra.AAC.1